MTDTHNLDTLDGVPEDRPLYGVIGWPVAHSLSPAMQQAAFDACGVPGHYIRLAVRPEELPAAVQRMKSKPFAGWNCTIPHKNAIYILMDRHDASAETIGGVNTVVHDQKQGTLTGHSTDGRGWSRAVWEDFGTGPGGLRILLLGAGGAGQAIAHQAVAEGCRRLVIVNRTEETALALAREIQRPEIVETRAWDRELLRDLLPDIDLVVNASSVGLKVDDAPALTRHLLGPAHMVYDTIYNPSPSGLLREAEAAGSRMANGLSMLLHQGALSFEIWTGREAPLEAMRTALMRAAAGKPV